MSELSELLDRLRDLAATYRRNRIEDSDNYAWQVAAEDIAALVREYDKKGRELTVPQDLG